ncbi:MAG: enoyl-CoA hydratase/isomerase family protein [Thermodesulfobacteriota bacterium]
MIGNEEHLARDKAPPVLLKRDGGTLSVVLHRPEALNSLNHTMVLLIQDALIGAGQDPSIRVVLFYGKGTGGFCAGGDIKAMARSVREGRLEEALAFLEAEYALDLFIHRFPKPVVVLADGITMGGGLGISAGADVVLATERTRTAMPETRIGFFPDVGATGWMFEKCPPGYPEYLGLTGHEMIGPECVRVGLATRLVASEHLPDIVRRLEQDSAGLSRGRIVAANEILCLLDPFFAKGARPKPDMDRWVKEYFEGKTSIPAMIADLRQCSLFSKLCEDVFSHLSERSPTALAVTLQLLRRNEGRPLPEVFEADLKAARFILSHPDFLEGVRARLVDKDDRPQWQPARIEEVGRVDFL